MAKRPKEAVAAISGPPSLFRNKVRDYTVTMTFTQRHHDKIVRAMTATGLTRADLLGLLVERYADRHDELRRVVAAMTAAAEKVESTTSGPPALFRNKIRPNEGGKVSLTLTQRHHDKIARAINALGVSRADLIGLLVERYADRHEELRRAVAALTKAVPTAGTR